MVSKKKSGSKRKTTKKTSSTRKTKVHTVSSKHSRDLIQISVNLQKVTTELVSSNVALTRRIDKLVNIFEGAAKTISGDVEGSQEDKVRQLSGKLETLIEQNKALADGLFMLEKYIRSKNPGVLPDLKPKRLVQDLKPIKMP